MRDYPEQAAKSDFDYELLDFGAGRKLERFGQTVVDRPAAGLERHAVRHPSAWMSASVRFVAEGTDEGVWQPSLVPPWTCQWQESKFELRTTAAGQVGIFPEQLENWSWLQSRIRQSPHPLQVLNLFAYTGGSTLAAAQAGAQVVHVDSQRSVVEWAQHNASRSGFANAPIRWIVDDAIKFVQREIRRHRLYDGIILDPPSYGHGIRGERWKFERDLSVLLDACQNLWRPEHGFLMLSCHTMGWDPQKLREAVSPILAHSAHGLRLVESCDMRIVTADGRSLPSGVVVRWPGTSPISEP
ncbi:MAG: class I SAM-dependent methyltransferase [Planctomycetota bacterium]|nr:class I SAM-dependent methyltransferase [Planctomycetota bacterium]